MTTCPQCEALKERVRELEGRVRALEQQVREPALPSSGQWPVPLDRQT